MNNQPIQLLMDEHDVISHVEKLIHSLQKWLNKNQEIYESSIQSLLIFFKEYADGYHHYKEERILFPKLNNHPDFSQQELIAELEEHHELFRDHLSTIKDSLARRDFEKVQDTLVIYVDELLDHIAVENDELFVMAESILTENELEKVYFAFMDIDVELGQNKKEQLIKLLKDIEQVVISS